MSIYQINALVDAYQRANYADPFNNVDRSQYVRLIDYGIKNGFIKEVEQRNAYTFGRVTVALTDTEIATIMRLVSDGNKIQAIKMLRVDVSDKMLTLRQAKDFVDHLGIILKKSRV